MEWALGLSAVVAIYNNAINRWEPFNGPAYVPVNLAFIVTLTTVASAILELSRAELGITPGDGIGIALAATGVFGIGAFTLARSRHGHRIADKRVIELRGAALAYYVLVRVPLGTAVPEEVLFRGVLFAAWQEAGMSTVVAATCASAAFGLWHITPTMIGARTNDPTVGGRRLLALVIGAVFFTTIAGLGLTWARVAGGGLIVPIVLHAGVNSLGTLAAVGAARRAT